MAQKVRVITSITDEIAAILKQQEVYNEMLPLNEIPMSFNDTIKRFMADNVGFDTGPITGLVKLNGEFLSLISTAFNGDLKVSDVLPIGPGELILELSVPMDFLICVEMNKLQELAELARQLGEEELIHKMLYESLCVGSIPEGDPNVFCYLPQIRKQDCLKFFRYNSEWKSEYSDILGGVEEVSISKMTGF